MDYIDGREFNGHSQHQARKVLSCSSGLANIFWSAFLLLLDLQQRLAALSSHSDHCRAVGCWIGGDSGPGVNERRPGEAA